jgi:hypothetical protein
MIFITIRKGSLCLLKPITWKGVIAAVTAAGIVLMNTRTFLNQGGPSYYL